MRLRLLAPAVAAAVLTGACRQSAVPTRTQTRAITQQVDSVVADLYDAMNAHDAEAVMRHYLPGDDFLYVGVTESIQGRDVFARTMGPWYRSHPDVTFEYSFLHTQVLSPTTATVTVSGSSSETPSLMTTRTLVLRNGQWFIALEHESWPGAEAPKGTHPGTEG